MVHCAIRIRLALSCQFIFFRVLACGGRNGGNTFLYYLFIFDGIASNTTPKKILSNPKKNPELLVIKIPEYCLFGFSGEYPVGVVKNKCHKRRKKRKKDAFFCTPLFVSQYSKAWKKLDFYVLNISMNLNKEFLFTRWNQLKTI